MVGSWRWDAGLTCRSGMKLRTVDGRSAKENPSNHCPFLAGDGTALVVTDCCLLIEIPRKKVFLAAASHRIDCEPRRRLLVGRIL
jgi:hypothetical protein